MKINLDKIKFDIRLFTTREVYIHEDDISICFSLHETLGFSVLQSICRTISDDPDTVGINFVIGRICVFKKHIKSKYLLKL